MAVRIKQIDRRIEIIMSIKTDKRTDGHKKAEKTDRQIKDLQTERWQYGLSRWTAGQINNHNFERTDGQKNRRTYEGRIFISDI
jgi:hypothetical protein